MTDKISLDELEDNGSLFNILNSQEFRDSFARQVEEDTWGQGLPKVYMDKDGWVVKHWKDGTIEKIKKT